MQAILATQTQIEDPPREWDEGVAALVARSKRGDVEAFTLLYRRHIDRLYAYVARRVTDQHAAEEVTQEVFYRAFRGIAGCRDEAAFSGWLFGIARFVIADDLRTRARTAQPLPATFEPQDPDPLPEEHVLHSERQAALQAARQHCLSARDREFLDLLLADLSDDEIATALGRRSGAVRTARWRLLTRLRACFSRLFGENGGRHVAP